MLTSYSWRRLGTTVGLLANFSVPQLAALGDWGDRISDAQAKMPVRYAGSRYALSRFCKHYAYFVAAHVRDYTTWEVIPPPAVDEACRLAKDEAALAVEQDCTVVWSSPARSSLEPPRLKLTAVARERLRKRSKTMAYSSQAVMPEVIGNKRVGPELRDGASMATPALLHTAVLRSIGQAVSVVGTTLLWSAGVQRCSGGYPHYTCPKATCQEEGRASGRESNPDAEGTLVLSGLPVHEQRHLYGQVALQVSALGQTPGARNGVTLQGACLLVSMRSSEDLARDWGEVFGIIARALWHGDCVVVHCMAGRRRAALLTCVALALLRGASLEATETWMLTRRQIELVRSRDALLWDWANRAVRGTRIPFQYSAPVGFTATESSHLRLQLPDGTALCRHAQGQARASNRLRNAYSTSDKREAVAWQRPICDECFRRASASFWPVV